MGGEENKFRMGIGAKVVDAIRKTSLRLLCNDVCGLKFLAELTFPFPDTCATYYLGSGYFAVDGNLPLESILP